MGLPEDKLCICNQPQPQNLTVGDALVLECGAVGNPIPNYQWFRNGFPLANGSKNVYTVSYCNRPRLGADVKRLELTTESSLEENNFSRTLITSDEVLLLVFHSFLAVSLRCKA